ncbi:hypothetical protein Q4595_03870 [Wenyingzhuangia sp. 1_MG-2023]|nr:hypothetical protein [Wenyingzhuangia sp. 1_MG-2023]
MRNIYIVLTMLMLLSSCATINSKSVYPVVVKSQENSNVTVYNKKMKEIASSRGELNQFNLKAASGYFSKAKYYVKVEKEGFVPSFFVVDSSIDPMYWGKWSDGANGLELFYMISGGIFYGMLLTDPITGAMYELENTNINANLTLYTTTVLNRDALIKKLEAYNH